MIPETKIYIKLRRKKYRFPVNPAEIKVSYGNADKTDNVAGVGEILIPQKPGLMTVTFSSFFPGSPDDAYTSDYTDPRALCEAFIKAWKSRTRCRLVISRPNGHDTTIRCVISDFSLTDKGGEPQDIYFEITLTEYRDFGVSQLSVIESTTATGPAAEIAQATGPASDNVAATEQSATQVTASAEPERPIDDPVLIVGASCVVSGTYYNDSYGGGPTGQLDGVQTTVTRIVSGNAFPVHVGYYGWVREDQIQLTGAGS